MEEAMNIPMALLHLRYQEISLDRHLVVVDEDGSRSFLAASYLSRKGFASIERLAGGMSAWDAYVKKDQRNERTDKAWQIKPCTLRFYRCVHDLLYCIGNYCPSYLGPGHTIICRNVRWSHPSFVP